MWNPSFIKIYKPHGTQSVVTNVREKARSIWIALKREGRCPTSCLKADSFAPEYFYRTMRGTYEQEQLASCRIVS